MKANILDRNWKYVSAAATDIRKTIRREQARLAAIKAEDKPVPPNVHKIEKVRR